MGRGRAKAKQTKVARQLKYGGPETDFDRLQAELASKSGHTSPGSLQGATTTDEADDDDDGSESPDDE